MSARYRDTFERAPPRWSESLKQTRNPMVVFKRVAPPPFKAGTVVAMAHGLAVRYAIESDGLRFHRVQRVGP